MRASSCGPPSPLDGLKPVAWSQFATAHAVIVALREAAQRLGRTSLAGVTANPDNAYRLLHDEEQLVLVFPEGTKGTGKVYSERYRLRRFGRGGFVEIAMVYVLTTGFGLAQNDAVAVAVLDRAVSVFSVIVVGGAGKHSCWQPTFGDQTAPARRPILHKDGTPLRSITELRR